MAEAHLLRDPFVARVHVRYVLSAVSAIHYEPADTWLKGDARVGQFAQHDGSGDVVVMAWDEAGVVALGFDHEHPESELPVALDARRPARWLASAPPELGAIVKVVSAIDPRLATTGFWATAKQASSAFLEDPLSDYQAAAADVLAAWSEQLSIDAAQAALGAAVAGRALRARTVLTDEEARILCAPPAASGKAPRPGAVRSAAKWLAVAGIDWDPEPLLATSAFTPALKRSTGDVAPADRERANGWLLRGAFNGRFEDVSEALASGADLDVTAAPNRLEHTPTGASALVIALRRGHRELAEQLVAAGANVDLMTEVGWGGPEYALRLAAAQGDATLVKLLLARGASVRPEEATWGVLRHVLEGRIRVRSATRARMETEYAEVLRMLLDHGAPLPSPDVCDALANLADRGGAPDVAARLATKPKTEVALPDVAAAPAVDETNAEAAVTRLLDDAIAALAAGDRARAVAHVEEAFRVARHPRLADLLDASPTAAVHPRKDAIEVLLSMPVTDDPRASRAALDALVTPKSATRPDAVVEASEDRAAAMLVASRDVRFTEALADRIARGRPGATRRDARASLVVALDALKAFTPPELGAENRDRVSQLDDALRGLRPAPGARAVRDLYEAVYDDPRNGALRDELAARLEAAGDPRGEFIRLQRARGPEAEPSKRERELLAAHATTWLGEIAKVIADDEVFRDGFVWQATTGERGAALTRAAERGPVLSTGAGLQREWATIERLSVWRHAGSSTEGLLAGRRLSGLRELTDVPMDGLHAIASGPPRALEILELAAPRTPEVWSAPYDSVLADALAKLPALREARIAAGRVKPERVEEILAAACGEGKSLHRVAVGVRLGGASRWVLEMARRLKLDSISVLSVFDLRYDRETESAEIAFTDALRDTTVDAAATELAALPDAVGARALKRLVVRYPPRAKLVGERRGGVAPVLSLKGKATDLAPLWALGKALGATSVLEPAAPHWSGSPKRDA